MLGGLTPAAQDGAYFKFEIPLSLFQCGSGSSVGSVANINRIDIMNTNTRDADFCIDYLSGIADGGATARSTAKPLAPAEAPAAPEEPAQVPTPTPAAPRAAPAAPAVVPVTVPAPPPAPARAPAPEVRQSRPSGFFPFVFPFFGFGRR